MNAMTNERFEQAKHAADSFVAELALYTGLTGRGCLEAQKLLGTLWGIYGTLPVLSQAMLLSWIEGFQPLVGAWLARHNEPRTEELTGFQLKVWQALWLRIEPPRQLH